MREGPVKLRHRNRALLHFARAPLERARMSPARPLLLSGLALLLALAGCGQPDSGPIGVSAIGGPPRLGDPNRAPLDPPSAFLTEAVAQGLVRFNAEGDIEPALAQSWIISDDGLTYTFRLRRT